jgi:hypothetical protein
VNNILFVTARYLLAAVGAVSLLAPSTAAAQALPTATGPGSEIQVGVQLSGYHINYGERYIGGGAIYANTNLNARYGIEAEARTFRLHEDEGIHDTTYLIGPRFSPMRGELRPYAKLLLGRGEFSYPFTYATGSYFVIAPGFGVDWNVHNGPLTVRVIDVEIQDWAGFSFGPLKPVGLSTGISWRILRGGRTKESDQYGYSHK